MFQIVCMTCGGEYVLLLDFLKYRAHHRPTLGLFEFPHFRTSGLYFLGFVVSRKHNRLYAFTSNILIYSSFV